MALLVDAFRRYGSNARLLDEAIERWSTSFGVDPNLSRAIAFQESSFNPEPPRGSAGEVGPFQVLPSTANWLRGLPSSPDAVRSADITTVEGNAIIGIYYLAQQVARFGDLWRAVAAYNAGPTRVADLIKRYGDGYFERLPSTTQRYVQSVRRLYDQLVAESAGSIPTLPPDVLSLLDNLSATLHLPRWAIALALILAGVIVLIGLLKG